jgi:hypothetical protein
MLGGGEGEATRRNWLRGFVLGINLALLLSGGVALAQTGSVQPYCYVCCDKCREPWACDG